ncbi:MAG: SHOCT domain-containing protein [Nitrospirae bacterium]|nr:SHOCT domain-containing protein [Nitrospirota bacterium]
MTYGLYGGGMWMFFHFIFWILVIIGVVLLIVWIVRQPHRYERGHGEESPLDVLRKRYARGEISKEEFERIKKDIL